MTTTPDETTPVRRERRRRTVGWTLAVLSTAGTGLVVGYGSIWFQLFGDTASAGDYRISAGGYATAAVLLLLAVAALMASSRPTLATFTLGVAGLYALQATSSATTAGRAADDGQGTTLEGIGGVLLSPTTWPLLVLSVLVLRRRTRSAPTRPE